MRSGSQWCLLACASLLCSLPGCSGGAAAEEHGRPERPPARVEVATAQEGTIRVTRTYLGQVRSLARADLSAGASGEVRTVAVREGDRVEAGALLLVIDERLARAQLTAAQAAVAATGSDLAQARRDAQRMHHAGDRLVAGAEIERAASQAETLSAQRRNQSALADHARAELSRHRVVAPFSGVIASRLVDPGDWVTPGLPVLQLVADDALEVHVRAEPALLDVIEVGHEATLRRGDESVPAEVTAFVPALDPATRTVEVRLSPRGDPPSWLLAGDTVDVLVPIERGGEGVIVPRDALVPGAVTTRVVKVADGHAALMVVDVLDRSADQARVSAEGLAPGDAVVVRGNERLLPDQPVQVVE